MIILSKIEKLIFENKCDCYSKVLKNDIMNMENEWKHCVHFVLIN